MTIKDWIAQHIEEKGKQWLVDNYELCLKETGLSVSSDSYMRYIREIAYYNHSIQAPEIPRVDYEESKSDINYVVTSDKIRTLEDLVNYCRVDLTRWEVTKFVCNTWGSGTNPSYQCKAWFTKKVTEDKESIRQNFIDDLKHFAYEYPIIKYEDKDYQNALEICLFDIHYGLESLQQETGDEYNLEKAEKLFMASIYHFGSLINLYNIEQIILPIGHDFFNVNSMMNTTVQGTVQDEQTRFHKTFTNARKMVVKAVDYLMTLAPVEIIMLGGNHDFERTYYLGDSLFCWYAKTDNVIVNNDPKPRKYWVYGKNLVGMSHGNMEKFEELPLIMATEVPTLWGESLYREWHTGHLHKNEIMERQNVRIRRVPSLVANSAWASSKGFNSEREAQAFIWNKNKGLTGVLNYHI